MHSRARDLVDNRANTRASLVLTCTVLSMLLLTRGAEGGVLSPTGAASETWIQSYGDVHDGRQFDVTPEDIQATSDGGYIALAITNSPPGLVNWLLKLDSSGNPIWQRKVEVPGLAPGAYTIGLSIQETSEGGYILGGGTIGGGSGDDCPPISGIECVWVTKLDEEGQVLWSRAYRAGPRASGLYKIRTTADGGYIGVGNAHPSLTSDAFGALILKLDSVGSIEWQRVLGPMTGLDALFNDVVATSEGDYAAVGQLYHRRIGRPFAILLVARVDAKGNIEWQTKYNNFDSSGEPVGSEYAQSILQTSDSGFLVAGGWVNPGPPAATDPLLLKLDPSGGIQWQTVYDGGVYCLSGHCFRLGGLVYSARETPDQGYVLAGFGHLVLLDSLPLEAWLAKTDSSGNLLWQHLYYAVYRPTGRPLGEHFASVSLAADGGFAAIGHTLIYEIQRRDLYIVKTDDAGLALACDEVHEPPPLAAADPAMTAAAAPLPVDETSTAGVDSPGTTVDTSVSVVRDCGAAGFAG